MEGEGRVHYGRLKCLTTVGPTVFVAVAEIIRYVFLRRVLPDATVSLVAVLVTLVGAAAFSSYVFDIVERMEREREAYKDAMLALRERNRLAREMHDGLAQNLAAINLKVFQLKDQLARGDHAAMEAELLAIQSAVNLSYSEVRHSLYDLKAAQRLEEGFWPTLARQVEEFQRQTSIEVRLEPLPDHQEPWNEMAAVQLLRIVQECLANVRKHAKARQVLISAQWHGPELELAVADDGVGFDPHTLEGSDRYGLSIMQERAETVGARVHLDSAPGKGTRVSIVLTPHGEREAMR